MFEIGGPDVVTYEEMMQLYAEVAGLKRRVVVPVPVAAAWRVPSGRRFLP